MKYILLIVALSSIVIIPLLLSGFILTHDMYFPLFRLYGMEQSFKEGQIPPRWISSFALGYGYPFFNFYAPLAYYLAYIFHLLGFGYVHSIHATIIVAFLFSGIGAYLWVKDLLGNKLAGLVSAIVYVYFPYHLVQVYVRGDISEFLATAFFPWVLYFIKQNQKSKIKNPKFIGAGFFYAAVILSHNIMAMIFTGFLVVYLIFLIRINKPFCLLPIPNGRSDLRGSTRIGTAYCLLSLLFGLGLSAYFWLPALAEKQFVSVQNLIAAADYRNHFVSFFDLINPRWGFGGSEAGAPDRMSVQLGLAPILLALTSLFLIFYKPSRNFSPMEKNWYWFSWIVLLILIFLMLPFSKPVWVIIPMMKYMLYPWRLLALIALPLSLVAGYLVVLIGTKPQSSLRMGLIAIIFTIACSAIYLRHRSIPVPENAITPEFIWNCESHSKTFGTTMSNEYLPRTVSRMPQEFAYTPIAVIAGEAEITPAFISGIKRVWKLEVKSPSVIQLNTFSFPGWQVYLDSQKYLFEPDGQGRMLIAIPTGNHQVKQVFKNTRIRNIGNNLSLLTFLIIIIFSFISSIKPSGHSALPTSLNAKLL